MTQRPASPVLASSSSSALPPSPSPSYFPDILSPPPTTDFAALDMSRHNSIASTSAASPSFTSPSSSAAASVIGDDADDESEGGGSGTGTGQSSLASSSFDLFAAKQCPPQAIPAAEAHADSEAWPDVSYRPSLSTSPTEDAQSSLTSASYSPTDSSQSSLTSLSVHSASPPPATYGFSKAHLQQADTHPHLAPLPSPQPPRHIQPSASLEHARSLLEHQAASLLSAARRLREEQETWLEFEGAQNLIVDALKRGGKLVWTGVGKSGE